MKINYLDLIEQTFDFPQREFELDGENLLFHKIPLMDIIKKYGTPLKFTYLPQIILISSVIGSVAGITMLVIGKTKQQQPIPFGPYLAVAGWIGLLWGETINTAYLAFLS